MSDNEALELGSRIEQLIEERTQENAAELAAMLDMGSDEMMQRGGTY